jgi:glycosyltransferase involved in cell wall biosynthesis
MEPTIGVVIPAYQPDINRLTEYVYTLNNHLRSSEIRIEIDAPAKRTVNQLADVPATVNVASCRRGKGAAITAGFEALSTDVLSFADADGATPAPEIVSIVKKVTNGGADLAVGSRRHPDANIISHQTFARRRLGNGFAWLARRLLSAKLYDYQCGAKAISAESWERVRGYLCEPGFAWDIELTAFAGAINLNVVEVPIRWEDKPGSTVSPIKDSATLFEALLITRHRTKQLKNEYFHTTIARYQNEPEPLIKRDK